MKFVLALLGLLLILSASCSAPIVTEEQPQAEQPQSVAQPTPTVTVHLSEPKPINAVLMLSSFGRWWSRVPPEETWTLEFVWCDAKNFLSYEVHLDEAVVEIYGQSEAVPTDITLKRGEYNRDIFIYTSTITGVPSGEHTLCVSLFSDGELICEREDVIEITWEEVKVDKQQTSFKFGENRTLRPAEEAVEAR